MGTFGACPSAPVARSSPPPSRRELLDSFEILKKEKYIALQETTPTSLTFAIMPIIYTTLTMPEVHTKVHLFIPSPFAMLSAQGDMNTG